MRFDRSIVHTQITWYELNWIMGCFLYSIWSTTLGYYTLLASAYIITYPNLAVVAKRHRRCRLHRMYLLSIEKETRARDQPDISTNHTALICIGIPLLLALLILLICCICLMCKRKKEGAIVDKFYSNRPLQQQQPSSASQEPPSDDFRNRYKQTIKQYPYFEETYYL